MHDRMKKEQQALREASSKVSSISAPTLVPASQPFPAPTLDTPLSASPTDAFADPSEQTLAQKKNMLWQVHNKAQQKARKEGQWKIYTLFNISTGKKAPKGAAKSKQYITFNTYVKHHVKAPQITRKSYVNTKTGEPAPGITKETYNRGQHTTHYNWLVKQKYAEFSRIINQGGDLPPIPPSTRNVRQNALAEVATKRKADSSLPRSDFVRPLTEASNAAADHHSPPRTSGPAIDLINTGKRLSLPLGLTAAELALALSFIYPVAPSPSLDNIASAASSVSAPILPPAPRPLSTLPLDTPLSSNSAGVSAASAHRHSSPPIASSDQASFLSPADLETFVDVTLSTDRLFAAEIDAQVLTSFTESDITAQRATGEQLPILAENPTENEVEMNYDLSFSEPVTPPAFSPVLTIPLYDYSVEASDVVTHARLDPVSFAAQDSFEQDTSRRRKRNFHSFFQPEENDRVKHASRKAKTRPSDGSAKHPLPATVTPDSASDASFIPSSAVKRPRF